MYTSSLFISAEQSFLSRAQYSSPCLSSSLILISSRKKTLNRIKVNLNYSPGNVRYTVQNTDLSVKRPSCSRIVRSGLTGSFEKQETNNSVSLCI